MFERYFSLLHNCCLEAIVRDVPKKCFEYTETGGTSSRLGWNGLLPPGATALEEPPEHQLLKTSNAKKFPKATGSNPGEG